MLKSSKLPSLPRLFGGDHRNHHSDEDRHHLQQQESHQVKGRRNTKVSRTPQSTSSPPTASTRMINSNNNALSPSRDLGVRRHNGHSSLSTLRSHTTSNQSCSPIVVNICNIMNSHLQNYIEDDESAAQSTMMIEYHYRQHPNPSVGSICENYRIQQLKEDEEARKKMWHHKEEITEEVDGGVDEYREHSNVPSPNPNHPKESVRIRPMLTRRASISSYGGEGFEIAGFDSQLLNLLQRTATWFLQDENDEPSAATNMDILDISVNSISSRVPTRVFQFDSRMNMDISAYGENEDFDCENELDYSITEDPLQRFQVLTPSIMKILQPHLPYCKRGERFCLKYSMVRDGSSSQTFLQNVKGCKYIVLALETVDGEVFGSFTAEPWHITHGYYGTCESFVWRSNRTTPPRTARAAARQQRRRNRQQQRRRLQRRRSFTSATSNTSCSSAYPEQVDIFHSSYANQCIQICRHDRIAVGGGSPSTLIPREMVPSKYQQQQTIQLVQPNQWGFALALEGDSMLEATSSPCITFNSPSLSRIHPDGSRLQVLNVEAWTLVADY